MHILSVPPELQWSVCSPSSFLPPLQQFGYCLITYGEQEHNPQPTLSHYASIYKPGVKGLIDLSLLRSLV